MNPMPAFSSIRPLLIFLLALFAAGAWAGHGMAQYGKPGYPAGFDHFGYVNPAAPKGGTLVLSPVQQTGFDKFNPFSLKGIPAPGLGNLLFESLVTGSHDEVASAYGLLADDVKVAADKLSVSFHLNPQARFANGAPVLAQDVKDSFETLISKLASPMYRSVYADVARVVVVGERDVRFEFRSPNAELPLIVGTMHNQDFRQTGFRDAGVERSLSHRKIRAGAFRDLSPESGVVGEGSQCAAWHVQFRAGRLSVVQG